jgi:hypothetical protein
VGVMDRIFHSIRVVPLFLGHKKNVFISKIALKFVELRSLVRVVKKIALNFAIKFALKIAINFFISKIALKLVELCSLDIGSDMMFSFLAV